MNNHSSTSTNSLINDVTRRNFCLTSSLCAFLPFNAATARPLRDDVIFAGVTQLGAASDFSEFMPLTSAIMERKTSRGQRIIDKAFRSALKKYPPNNLNLIDTDSSLEKEDALVLAAALNFEHMGNFVSSAHGGKSHNYLFIELYGQALLVNLAKLKIVQSYPFRIYTAGYKVKGQISNEKKTKAFEDFVLGEDWIEGDPVSVLFAKKIQNLPFNNDRDLLYLQVQNISLEDRAKKTLRSLSVDPAHYGRLLGYTASASLSEQLLFPLLPYKIDRTIGGVMTSQFGGSSGANNLKQEDPNYGVDVILRGFKKVVVKETKYTEYIIAAAYVRIIVRNLDREKVIFDQKIKSLTPEPRLSLKRYDDTWNTYQQLVIRLLDNFSQTAGDPTISNIKNKCHIKKPEKLEIAAKQFKDLKSVIDKCRGWKL